MKETTKNSPLYTPKKLEEQKRDFIMRVGKDKDGAYRVDNRIDGKKMGSD